MITVRHNLGLGDHIMCYGMIVELLKEHKEINLMCKEHNKGTVRFMYRNHNVNLVDPSNMECLDIKMTKFVKPLDISFYEKAGVDFDKRLQHPERSKLREEMIYNIINPQKPYVFIHEDVKRGMIIKDEYKKNYYSPKLGLTENIYDYCKLIEEAEEIHCIESSFSFMIDYTNLGKLNVHRYARHLTEIEKPTYTNANIIE